MIPAGRTWRSYHGEHCGCCGSLACEDIDACHAEADLHVEAAMQDDGPTHPLIQRARDILRGEQ